MKKILVGFFLISFAAIAQDSVGAAGAESAPSSRNELERQKIVEEEYKIELIRKRANLEYEKEKMRVMSKPKGE